jgi:hypothetical protein
VAIVALVLSCGGAGAESRYDKLTRVINRNTGFAHMTRGVNMYTLIALRSCVSDDALRDVDSPQRKALADYPLTERERKSIRGSARSRS